MLYSINLKPMDENSFEIMLFGTNVEPKVDVKPKVDTIEVNVMEVKKRRSLDSCA